MKHQNRNIKINKQQAGFSGLEILICVVVVGLIAAAGATVVHRHDQSQAVDRAASKTASSSTAAPLSSSSSPSSTLATQGTAAATPSTSTSTSSKSTSKTTATTSTKASTPPKTTTTPAAPATPATLLSTLTNLIAGLDNGQSVNVTATSIAIPGPITTAHGRPIVFTFNGTKYFAYRQESAIDFNQTPAQTANTLAWPVANLSGTTLTQAHLDKLGNLVDEDEKLVGYSTGGD